MSDAFDKRLAPWFETRRWRVMHEASGDSILDGVTFHFTAGEFVIDQPGVFVTPLGHSGRRGFLIIETGPDGSDVLGTEVTFGEATLRRASELFSTVSGLPEAADA